MRLLSPCGKDLARHLSAYLRKMTCAALFEAGIVLTYWQSAITLATGRPPVAMGSAHPLSAPYQAFETSDGWITVGAANQTNWLKLLDVLETPELQDDSRFATNEARTLNLKELVQELKPIFKRHSNSEWLERLQTVGVPAGPVINIAEMQAHPQTIAREMVPSVPHSKLGTKQTIGHPLKFSATPAKIDRGAPVFGEHSRELLAEHGYSEKEINSLITEGVVYDW